MNAAQSNVSDIRMQLSRRLDTGEADPALTRWSAG
jgi:hypothetical protein